MATNIHATIRYHALDRCISNAGKNYFIDELIEECSKAIYNFTGTSKGISARHSLKENTLIQAQTEEYFDTKAQTNKKRVKSIIVTKNYKTRATWEIIWQ